MMSHWAGDRTLTSAAPAGLAHRTPRWGTMLALWSAVFLLVWTAVRPAGQTPLYNPSAQPRPVTPRGDLAPEEQATINIFREASPSVVFITNIDYRRSLFNLNIFKIPKGAGSGFVYDSSGYVVTNFHVIAGASELEVTLADQSVWQGRVVGAEMDKDLAVLKIDAPRERLKALPLGTSHDLQVGQKVFAIGNPFGLDQTLTTGVVSAVGREIESVTGRKIRDVIQTDAAINPGNSGGPLLDSQGRLIGVNTQIASPSGASAGIGFAVPVDTVNDIVPDLIRFGHWIRPGLGITAIQDHVARRAGIRGVIIDTVSENSGAAAAGLRGTVADNRGYVQQLGDIIIKIDEQEVANLNQLKDALDLHKAGDEVEVTYVREEQVRTAKVTLQRLP